MYKQQQVACRLTSLNYKVNKVRSLYKNRNTKKFFKYENKAMGRKKTPNFFEKIYIYI